MAKEKIFPHEVLEILKEKHHVKRKDIAEILECSTATVSKKINKLVKGGENIGYNNSGVFILNKTDIKDDTNRDLARKWLDHVINVLQMWAHRGNNHKAIALEVRKRFPKELNNKELTEFKGGLLLVTRAVDAILLDKELS